MGLVLKRYWCFLNPTRTANILRQLEENLTGLGIQVYQPRVGAGIDPDIEQLFEFLVLAASIMLEGPTDDLAVRSLLELRPNNIGETRIWRVVSYCFEEGLEFLQAIDRFRERPSLYTGTGIANLLQEVDEILRVANQVVPDEEEDFRVWIDRAFRIIGVTRDKRAELDRILDPLFAELEGLPDEDRLRRDYVGAVIGAMTSLGDTKPAKVDGQVTITTMHGAKGLSAEVVIVLQAEDEVIPGRDTSALEEDEARRLLYVSLTRAKQRLVVTACLRRTGNQRFVGPQAITARNLTRFLQDLGLQSQTVDQYLESAAFR